MCAYFRIFRIKMFTYTHANWSTSAHVYLLISLKKKKWSRVHINRNKDGKMHTLIRSYVYLHALLRIRVHVSMLMVEGSLHLHTPQSHYKRVHLDFS